MLVAIHNDSRIEASSATRGGVYHCPGCGNIVVLKQGRIRVHHFAHKQQSSCLLSMPETPAHRQAKLMVRDSLRKRGLKAEMEWIVDCLPGDRRADVMVWNERGNMFAIEIQQSSIGIEEITLRTKSYFRVGIAVAWIILGGEHAFNNDDATQLSKSIWIPRYPAHYWQQWIHDFNKDHLWMINPADGNLWRGIFEDCHTWIESTDWGGGYHKTLKRYKELTLTGPFLPDDLLIHPFRRNHSIHTDYHIPGGKAATLTPRVAS